MYGWVFFSMVSVRQNGIDMVYREVGSHNVSKA